MFTVILAGWIARKRGLIPESFLGPANRLVFHLAIPAMIFRSISGGSFDRDFNLPVVLITLAAIITVFILMWSVGRVAGIERRRFATVVQSSFHGNLGYIGLAVAYYYLGDQGLAQASILAGFVMILQNLLAVIVLQWYGDTGSGRLAAGRMILGVAGNPVILSAMAGILFSAAGMPLPVIPDRALKILGDLALPLALLLIGASLTFGLVRSRPAPLVSSFTVKLGFLPGIGIALFHVFKIPAAAYLPAMILLASPTATIVYVMAAEMNGDTEFAAAAISASTMLSAVTFVAWLHVI
jgi:predicted permease